jgi:hypothetical protein
MMSEIEIKDGTLSAQLTFDIDISDLIPVADDAIYYSVSHGEGCIIYNSTDSHEDEFFRKCSIASIVDDFIEECTGFSSCIDDFHSLDLLTNDLMKGIDRLKNAKKSM